MLCFDSSMALLGRAAILYYMRLSDWLEKRFCGNIRLLACECLWYRFELELLCCAVRLLVTAAEQ